MEQNIFTIIDRLKEDRGITEDQQLAKLLGMTKASLSYYRTNSRIPIKYLSKYAELNKISLDWILTGTGPREAVIVATEGRAEYNSMICEDFGQNIPAGKDLQECIDAVIEIMLSDHSAVKAALKSNLVAFLDAVRVNKEMDGLRREVRELKSLIGGPKLRNTGSKAT